MNVVANVGDLVVHCSSPGSSMDTSTPLGSAHLQWKVRESVYGEK